MNREEIAKSSIMRKNEPVESCSFLIGVLDVSSFVHAYQIQELNTKYFKHKHDRSNEFKFEYL